MCIPYIHAHYLAIQTVMRILLGVHLHSQVIAQVYYPHIIATQTVYLGMIARQLGLAYKR